MLWMNSVECAVSVSLGRIVSIRMVKDLVPRAGSSAFSCGVLLRAWRIVADYRYSSYGLPARSQHGRKFPESAVQLYSSSLKLPSRIPGAGPGADQAA